MKAILIPDQITKLSAGDVIRAFERAAAAVLGYQLSHKSIALLVAQSALETGRWKSIHCFNFGNIKASEEYEGFYCLFRCNEIIKGKTLWFDPPHPQCRFRAYRTAEEGAYDYIRFLSQRPRYAKAWKQLLAGDSVTFVWELKAAGYFTADLAHYTKAVVSLANEYMRELAKMTPPPLDAPDADHSTFTQEDLAQRVQEAQLAFDDGFAEIREMRDAEIQGREPRLPGKPVA